ncbi:LrgB family protein [Cohnella lubricantis]|uniref:LrgB family protein n=1 Tax=Cohnella lubricantis TaxID=2163172 RepID=A0A841TA73_9BACL|nr:LrgB family protein [Cohnella lubricantis]MBB6676939.1 LrgB family protein [Cohnella lubricantis]MBP2118343.1 putative murein hydrolase (TIGR00659 family) [Cohnella lubricantis]
MSAVLWFCVTVAVYFAAKRLYKRVPKIYLTPLLVTPIILIIALKLFGVSFASYDHGAELLSDMVEPATIALAVTLYKHMDVLRKHALAIAAGAGCGAVAAIVTSVELAQLFRLPTDVTDSLAPRSSTTPIALSIADMIGGIPTITAVATLFTGVLGLVMGPLIVRGLRMRSPVARGVLFGTSAHSAGISKALEYDAVTGSVASIAMIFTAFVTLCVAPWIVPWFG